MQSNMQGKRVYYSPSSSNEKIIQKLKKITKLKFEPLPSDPIARTERLKTIKEGIYIWADGRTHHESYFFTYKKAKGKINIDAHSDFDDGFYIDYYNHMRYTMRDNVEIITTRYIENTMTKEEKKEALIKTIEEAEQAMKKNRVKEYALTIDCDAIIGFPVINYWVYDWALEPIALIEKLKNMRGRVALFDFGGLAPNIKDFELRGKDLEKVLEKPPAHKEIMMFTGELDYLGKKAIKQSVIDKVGTYATAVYAALIDIFI